MQTLLEGMTIFSIGVNGVLVPAKNIEKVLTKSTRPLFVWNNSETYPCSVIGSCVAINYHDQYFLVCTRHQMKALNGRSPENIGFLDEAGEMFVSSSGFIHHTENHIAGCDLLVLNFTPPCMARPQMKHHFSKVYERPPDVWESQIVGFVVAGYPEKDIVYELGDNRHIGFQKRIVVCKLAKKTEQSGDSSILRLKPLGSLNFDPNGMSGGSAYVILQQGDSYTAYFAGVISRAGKNDIWILRAGYILDLLSLFSEWPS